jgi:hypothetical protein
MQGWPVSAPAIPAVEVLLFNLLIAIPAGHLSFTRPCMFQAKFCRPMVLPTRKETESIQAQSSSFQ